MPNWKQILEEIQKEASKGPEEAKSSLDTIRRKYLKLIHQHTGRNVIAYYSAFLSNSKHPSIIINDKDITGLMACIHQLDKKKGLDLILHTPGGDIAATEAFVDYLYSVFKNDIRAIVPQIAMSAGTLVALSTKMILMGKHSSLGPIDPQINGIATQALLKEFETAKKEILDNPKAANYWQFIISKYHPTLLIACKQATDMSEELVKKWLERNMCKGECEVAENIVRVFSNHEDTKMHSRHICLEKCKQSGVSVFELENDNELQDRILSAHHSFIHTFSQAPNVTKIIENHNGVAYVEQIQLQNQIQFPIPIQKNMQFSI